jgi:ATP-dependent helicase/nuclease subunit A
MNELTLQQKLSLATDKNVAVTAGAGTGKTKILVERYIHILLTETVDIKEVLAITFTDKAAAEMMERIAKRIEELLDSNSTDLNKAKLFQIKNRLNSSYISTIHAFCSRLLRENPIEALIDPDFKILNDFQNTLLQNESINEVMEIINQDRDEWIEFFRLFGLNNIINMLEFGLSHRFELNKYITENQDINSKVLYDKLVKYFLNTVKSAFDESLLQSIDSIIQSIPENEFPTAKQNPKGAIVVDIIQSYLKSNSVEKSLEYWKCLFVLANVFTAGNGNSYKNLAQLGSKKSWSDSSAQLLVKLSEKINPVFFWVSGNPSTAPAKIDKLALAQMPKFYKLYNLVLQHYSQKKTELSSLDFEDMQIIALNLMQDNPEVCAKISGQFKYIMVDEFQDTNLLQWEIISKLGSLNENKFFIVGDPKQSIYGFRNADVRVFREVKKQFEKYGDKTIESGDINLSDSFRFKVNVNSFINDTFNSVLSDSKNNPWEVNYDSLFTSRHDKSGGGVEIALLSENDSVGSQPEFIIRRITQIVNQSNYKHGDIAILLRTRNHLNEIEEQLRKSEIPFKTVGGIGFYQRQEIYDVYHLIQFLINPHNDLALVGVLRSPFANISDEGFFFLAMARNKKSYWDILSDVNSIDNLPENDLIRLLLFRKRALRWIQRRDRIEFSELLEEIVHECFYQVSMLVDFNGEQLFANLKKIIRISEEYEKSGFTSLIDFAESLKQLINSTTREGEAQTDLEDETTVKIITVHQAKGLEFPVVFHPYLEQQIKSFPTNCYFDKDWGIVSKINSIFSENNTYYLLELLQHEQQYKELAELKRLFYVACSRARDFLILTSTIKKDKIQPNTPLNWLLNSLDISHREITEGKNENKEKFRIWNELPELEKSEKSSQNKALSSINTLKNSKRTDVTELSYYLNQIITQPQKEIFSATQLMNFIKDKKSYFNRYHLGFFEEDYDRLITSEVEQDLAIIKGKVIHKYLELYPNTDLDSLLFEFEILNPDFINELKNDLTIFKRRIKESKFLAAIMDAIEFKNEVAVTMKLGDSFLTGTIDRMYKNENSLWEVVDYKTNRIESNQMATTAESYKTQIEVYAFLLSSIFPEQENFTVTLYFIQPDDYFQKVFTKDELSEIENKLLQTVQELKQYYPYTNKSLIPYKSTY